MKTDLDSLAASFAQEGEMLLAHGRVADALVALDRAVKLAPRLPNYRFKRALAKARAGMLYEARTEMAMLVELEPANAEFADALRQFDAQTTQREVRQAGDEPSVVLVVDDDEDITQAIADRLRQEGLLPRRAHNLQEALTLGTQRPLPAAAIYDYYLGEMTGLEVRDELSFRLEQQGLQEPPYVVLTARNNPLTERYATKLGARAYVLKSNWLDPENGLLAAVRKMLQR